MCLLDGEIPRQLQEVLPEALVLHDGRLVAALLHKVRPVEVVLQHVC